MKKKLSLRLAAAALTAGVALSFSTPAFAANPAPSEGAVSGSNVEGNGSFGAGYNGVINGHAAAYRNITIEGGDTVRVLCIQEGIDFNGDMAAVFSALTRDGSGVPNLSKAAGIAVNSARIGTPLEKPNDEAAAAQLAVWKYTNNLDYSNIGNNTIITRADFLYNNAPDQAEAPTSFVLKAAGALEGENNVVTATLTGNGAPLVSEDLTVSLPGGATQTAETNEQGVATFTVPATETEGTATVTYKTVLREGSVLAPVDGQMVVTVDPANITRTATAPLAPLVVEEPPVVTPEPEPTTPPVVTPEDPAPQDPAPQNPAPADPGAPAAAPASDKPAQLPYTGTWVTPTLLLLALAGAGAGYGVRRYMKTH